MNFNSKMLVILALFQQLSLLSSQETVPSFSELLHSIEKKEEKSASHSILLQQYSEQEIAAYEQIFLHKKMRKLALNKPTFEKDRFSSDAELSTSYRAKRTRHNPSVTEEVETKLRFIDKEIETQDIQNEKLEKELVIRNRMLKQASVHLEKLQQSASKKKRTAQDNLDERQLNQAIAGVASLIGAYGSQSPQEIKDNLDAECKRKKSMFAYKKVQESLYLAYCSECAAVTASPNRITSCYMNAEHKQCAQKYTARHDSQ